MYDVISSLILLHYLKSFVPSKSPFTLVIVYAYHVLPLYIVTAFTDKGQEQRCHNASLSEEANRSKEGPPALFLL